jgi:hypothetical protein
MLTPPNAPKKKHRRKEGEKKKRRNRKTGIVGENIIYVCKMQ